MNEAPDCPSWRNCGLHGAGCCAKNKFGGRPSFGVCKLCLAGHPDVQPQTGLGSTIARITDAAGVKKCGGCAKREVILNRWGDRFAQRLCAILHAIGFRRRNAKR